MATALITGAGGFTGYHLIRELAAHGYEPVGMGRGPCPSALSGIRYEQIDLLDADRLGGLIRAIRPSAVFHLAGMSHVTQGTPEAVYTANIVASRNLLAALADGDAAPDFVLLASTANLYGNKGGTLDESTPPEPLNDYAVSKLAMEYMAAIWKGRLPLTVVRPFNYTGAGQSEAFLIPKLVRHFKERLPVIELGNTHVVRDFSDVRDVVSLYVRLAEVRAPWGPYNVCSGTGHALSGILHMLTELTGHELEVRVNPAFVRRNEVHTLIGSRARLESRTGPFEPIPLRETLRWMLEA